MTGAALTQLGGRIKDHVTPGTVRPRNLIVVPLVLGCFAEATENKSRQKTALHRKWLPVVHQLGKFFLKGCLGPLSHLGVQLDITPQQGCLVIVENPMNLFQTEPLGEKVF